VRIDRLGGAEFLVRFEQPYAIGKYPVTRADYAAFVQATGYTARGCTLWRSFGSRQDPQTDWRAPGLEQARDEPVVCVSWPQAEAYINWLREQTGEPYRLPSEAEWEHAARAGAAIDGAYWLKGGLKPGGANCADCGGIGMMGREDLLSTKAVGMYEPNAFGLHEMLGNVAQGVADCANPSFAGAPQDGSSWIGNITPLSPPARWFAFLEGIFGQIYLALLVARLVGLHITYSSTKRLQNVV
jgi:formylglycine-generating enzyme required for sulfatase activity